MRLAIVVSAAMLLLCAAGNCRWHVLYVTNVIQERKPCESGQVIQRTDLVLPHVVRVQRAGQRF
jgi:hypothetical protein